MTSKFPYIALFLIPVLLTGCRNNPEILNFKAGEFKDPPDSAKVGVWWHWVDGYITKEGITKDMEAMGKLGIYQATIFDVEQFEGQNLGLPKISFNSPEWYELFSWTLKEAKRLNIKIGVHNCAGWSSSGGPWITPEHAMKQFTWTKIHIKGGSRQRIQFSEPYSVRNFYRDVAVVAFKSEKPNSFIQASPEITLNDSEKVHLLYDGCPVSGIELMNGHCLTISFSSPFEAEKITIHPRSAFGGSAKTAGQFSLFAKENKTDSYKKIKEFIIQGVNETVSIDIPKTKSNSFKLQFNDLKNHSVYPVSQHTYLLGELELLKIHESPYYSPSISNHPFKTASIGGARPEQYSITGKEPKRQSINLRQIVDLTAMVDNKGCLNWNVPDGDWTVIRFGYTVTGAMNYPASREGLGLECDKMDTASLNVHYKNFPQKLIDHAGDFTGNTFSFLLIDSWEAFSQNWTTGFPETFEKVNGYPVSQWIPALCGEIMGSLKQSESFLHDFRSTVAWLIENNYYKHFADLCHRSGLELHCEVIYGGARFDPSMDILKANSYADMPMHEFWKRNNSNKFIEYIPSEQPEFHFAASAGLFYGKPVTGGEGYTDYVLFSESPWELKPFGDRAYCSGINQVIFVCYDYQPDERKPGMTTGRWGFGFSRHSTYRDHISSWLNYHARIQYLMQNTSATGDILYYVGDRFPQYLGGILDPTGGRGPLQAALPKGYALHACNFDILKNKLHVKDHKIVAENGTSFSLLVLPEPKGMNYSTLLRLEEIIRQGAYVYGSSPEYPLSLSDEINHKEKFSTIIQKIWGRNCPEYGAKNYGKGKVLWGMSLSEAINRTGLVPDFSVISDDPANFLFIHRRNPDADIYFVVNQLDHPVSATCKFRLTGSIPEIWNPVDGYVSVISKYTCKDDSCVIPFRFDPREATFFVFNKKQDQKLPELKTDPLREISISNFNGIIEFHPEYEEKIPQVAISRLKPLSEFDDDAVKYFAGQACYTINFEFQDSLYAFMGEWYLNIGYLDATAEVLLNGQNLGYVWNPWQKMEVSNILQPENRLEVRVAVPYINRFKGDFIMYGTMKNIWTSADIQNYIPSHPLKKVGLAGPLRLINYK